MSRIKFYFVLILIMLTFLVSIDVIAEYGIVKEKQADSKYIPEHQRARLKEVRECIKEEPGTSWIECRHECAELCNQILEPYERGVCNGVAIQLCCSEHPTGCK